MSPASHDRFAPPPESERLVEHLWVMRAPAATAPWRALLVPNGRPSVVVCLGEPGERIEPLALERSANAGTISGVRRLPAVLEQSGEAWYVGARLRPYGLAALGLADHLVDDAAPLEVLGSVGIDPAALVESVRTADGVATAAAVLARELTAAAREGAIPADRLVMLDRAIAVLEARRGLVTAVDLARAVGVPAMILDTAVAEFVGVGLDEFTAMTRFHHFVGGPGGPEQGEPALRALHRYRVKGRTPRETLRFTGFPPARYEAVRDAVAAVLEQSPVP